MTRYINHTGTRPDGFWSVAPSSFVYGGYECEEARTEQEVYEEFDDLTDEQDAIVNNLLELTGRHDENNARLIAAAPAMYLLLFDFGAGLTAEITREQVNALLERI